VKNGATMARPTKMTPNITKKIGDNIALELSYSLAAEAAGVTYKTFNIWMNRGQAGKSGKYHQFYKHIQKRNSDAAKALLERLNEAIDAGNCPVCMWILERRFSEDFGRREYRKMNIVSENLNENVELTVKEGGQIRKQILAKFDRD
jgi:abortive infection bacteriophage resistance protein